MFLRTQRGQHFHWLHYLLSQPNNHSGAQAVSLVRVIIMNMGVYCKHCQDRLNVIYGASIIPVNNILITAHALFACRTVCMSGNNPAITDVECLNCWNAVYAVGAGRHYIARIQGQPLNTVRSLDRITFAVCP